MIGEVALAIEMGADAVDIGKTIHPSPDALASRRHGCRSRTAPAPTYKPQRAKAAESARPFWSKTMTQDEPGRAARDYVAGLTLCGAIPGVGTGSTANFFIDEIVSDQGPEGGTVASSEATARRLQATASACSTNDVGGSHGHLCRWRRRPTLQWR